MQRDVLRCNSVAAQASTTPAAGGGISGAFSDVTLTSTILALNTAPGGPDCAIDLASGDTI